MVGYFWDPLICQPRIVEQARRGESMTAHTGVGVCLSLLEGVVREAGLWTYFLLLSDMFPSTDRGRTVLIFSKLGGETTEKHTKKTSVWGYDNGRSRLFNQLYQGIKASFDPIIPYDA